MKPYALLLVAFFFIGCASSGHAPDGWSYPGPVDDAPAARVYVATEPAEQTPPSTTRPEPVEDEEESEFPRNGLGVSMTYVNENRSEGGWAVGLEYSYRFNRSWAIGGIGEYLSGDFDVFVLAALGYWFPLERVEGLGIGFGPGVELNEGQKDRWLGRVGVFYEFEEKNFYIAPEIYADFLDDGDIAVMVGGTIGIFF